MDKAQLILDTVKNKATRGPIYKLAIKLSKSNENFFEYSRDLYTCEEYTVEGMPLNDEALKETYPIITEFFETLDAIASTVGRKYDVKKRLEETAESLIEAKKNRMPTIKENLITQIYNASKSITLNENTSSNLLLRVERTPINYYQSSKRIADEAKEIQETLKFLERKKPNNLNT